MNLTEPYFITNDSDNLPGLDFTRDIKQPGEHPQFPEGVIGIYCDGNFYCVAAIPLSYIETPLPDIIAEIFPQWKDRATYTPDANTPEYTAWWYDERLKFSEKMNDRLEKDNRDLREKIARLESNRDDLKIYPMTKARKQRAYFLNQYVALLITFAHEFVEHNRPETKALCDKCGMLHTDRIHMKRYIDAKRHPHNDPFWYHEDD